MEEHKRVPSTVQKGGKQVKGFEPKADLADDCAVTTWFEVDH